jgi:hypothetical protein
MPANLAGTRFSYLARFSNADLLARAHVLSHRSLDWQDERKAIGEEIDARISASGHTRFVDWARTIDFDIVATAGFSHLRGGN